MIRYLISLRKKEEIIYENSHKICIYFNFAWRNFMNAVHKIYMTL